jgi:hypothetical protein
MIAKKRIVAFVVSSLALLPNAGMAQQANQAPMTYADFALTQADLIAFNRDGRWVCLAVAAASSDPTSGQVECDLERFALLNVRLAATLEKKAPPIGTPANRQFLSDNAQWKLMRHKACEAKFASLGEGTLAYMLAFSPCFAEEVFRRITWLERAQ